MNKKNKILLTILLTMLLLIGGYYFFNTTYAYPDNWYEDYTYIKDDTAKTITLTKYNGSDVEIVIPAKAAINGKNYSVIVNNDNNSTTKLFSGNDKLTKVTFENGIKAGNSLRSMFAGCTSLVEVVFNDFDTSDVTNMSRMFYNCASLEELDLSGFNTSNTQSMPYIFYGCSSLKKLDVSNFDTTNTTNLYYFISAAPLNEIKLGKKTDFKLNEVGGYTFGRGTWRRLEDNKLYSAVTVAKKSSTENMAGTYVKVSNFIEEMSVNYPITYRIESLNGIDEFTTTNPSIFAKTEDNKVYLKNLHVASSDDYVVPGEATLLLKNVVTDKDGNKFNLRITISNVHLYDINTDEGVSTFYARIFNVSTYLASCSYFYSDSELSTRVYQNSPIKENITLEVIDNNGEVKEGSILFSAYDLDQPSHRDKDSIYEASSSLEGFGLYSEGIELISGYDENTLKMYSNTALIKDNNRIFGIHTDGGTEFTEFLIKVDAKKFKFTWTGEDCATTLMTYYQPRIVEVAKQDEKGNNISGATLELYQGDNLFDTFVTETTSTKLFLTPGFYTLKEKTVPNGYVKASDISFYIDYDGKLVLNSTEQAKVVMVDNYNKYSYIVNYLDKETGEKIHESKIVDNVKFKTSITSSNEIINIATYKYDSVDKDSIVIGTDENVINIYYTKIKGGIVEKHLDEYNNTILDEEEHLLPVGTEYNIGSKQFDNYRLVETRLPNNASGIVSEEGEEVIYYYRRVFNVETRVEGTGGTIEGDEKVLEGDDSTPERIRITPDENHLIESIMINGEEIEITDERGMVLEFFREVLEDKEVIVRFKEVVHEVPKTDQSTILPIIAVILVVIGIIVTILGFKKKKKVLKAE